VAHFYVYIRCSNHLFPRNGNTHGYMGQPLSENMYGTYSLHSILLVLYCLRYCEMGPFLPPKLL
jgi:hypothetical protein